MEKNLKNKLKKDLKVSEVVEEILVHDKYYKDKGYWNEIEERFCGNKSKRKLLKESVLKIYEFKYYDFEKIKKDFGGKIYERVAMFLTVLYNEHLDKRKFRDWDNVYMSTEDLKLYLKDDYNKILDKLSVLGKISIEKQTNIKYFKRGFCKYIKLNEGFRDGESESYDIRDIRNKKIEDEIRNFYFKKINKREGVEKYVEEVLDICSFDLGDELGEKNDYLAESKYMKEVDRLNNAFLSEKDRKEIEQKIGDKEIFIQEYLKNANDYYNCLMMKLNSIDWVRKYYYNIKVDEYGNRLSHIVSNMPKIYRKDLKIDGEEVVEIDIVSSQVAFLTILLNKLFNSGEELESFMSSSFGGKSFKDLKKEVGDKVNAPQLLIEKLELMYSEDSLNEQNGTELDLYKFMGLKLKGLRGISNDEIRTEMKGVFMGLLFGSTKFEKYKGKDRKEIINEVFGPDFFELLQSIEKLDVEGIKKKKYRNLSALLQREESQFLNTVMEELMEDKIKFLPLYDCLIVKKSDEERVKEAFATVISKNGFEGIVKVK